MHGGASGSQTKEQSVKSSYTVVYILKNKEWKVLEKGGWSEVHLCSDSEDGSFRILAWSVDTQAVLLNSNVNEHCTYKASKKDNFHSFTDENKVKYGLGFHKAEDAMKQAQEFLKTVRAVIQNLKDQRDSTGGPALKPDPSQTQQDLEKRGFIERKNFKPLGELTIMAPKPIKHKDSDANIMDPKDVSHTRHGYYDKEARKFKGNFPEGFLEELNKQFGVPIKQLPSRQIDGYTAKIPQVLLDLKNSLKSNKGYEQVGIFRLAPNAKDSQSVKSLIDKGDFKKNCDVNVTANLIKVWFRDLPKPLLNSVKPGLIEEAQSVAGVRKAMANFPEPNKSILMWLWDLCVEVAEFKETNKMSPQNLAIVIGPNLFNTDSIQNPMAAMTFSAKVVTFFQRGIEFRQEKAR